MHDEQGFLVCIYFYEQAAAGGRYIKRDRSQHLEETRRVFEVHKTRETAGSAGMFFSRNTPCGGGSSSSHVKVDVLLLSHKCVCIYIYARVCIFSSFFFIF